MVVSVVFEEDPSSLYKQLRKSGVVYGEGTLPVAGP